MKIVLVPAHGTPCVKEIENTLESVQAMVGGNFEVVRFTKEISVACNEEGLLLGLPCNESISGICGDCFMFASEADKNGEMQGLTDGQAKTVMQLLGGTNHE